MNKQRFVPQTDENRYLNTTHKCNLTGAELSTILYCLEGYVAGLDDCIPQEDDDKLVAEIDEIFEELEGVVDKSYDVESCIIRGEDYADCVDKLVESMEEN